ncbi:MAG: hypothetical protein ABSF12_26015, partial [Bryobacteraceae bacterium]
KTDKPGTDDTGRISLVHPFRGLHGIRVWSNGENGKFASQVLQGDDGLCLDPHVLHGLFWRNDLIRLDGAKCSAVPGGIGVGISGGSFSGGFHPWPCSLSNFGKCFAR